MAERHSAVQAARQLVIEREKQPLFGRHAAPESAFNVEAKVLGLEQLRVEELERSAREARKAFNRRLRAFDATWK